MVKLRGHPTPQLDGSIRIDPCPDDGRDPLVLRPMVAGKPLMPNALLVRTEQLPDGHVEYEIVHRVGGPPQVATEAYRDGWEETFSKGELN